MYDRTWLFWTILTVLLCILIYELTEIYFIHKVRRISSHLKKLRKLNDKYSFFKIQRTHTYHFTLETKAKYDNFDPKRHMQDLIYENMDQYQELISQVRENRIRYGEYIEELEDHPEKAIRRDARLCGLSVKKYRKVEDRLLEKEQQTPRTSTSASCIVSYTSPQGRNHYEKEYDFDYDEVVELLDEVSGRDSRKASMQYERSLVTPKLRYQVMKRDGFRCQLCGRRSGDGVELHVDHIVPISKGGKSDMSNLRTLCDYCNIGKGAEYDPNDDYR